jgi:hypothetical protein
MMGTTVKRIKEETQIMRKHGVQKEEVQSFYFRDYNSCQVAGFLKRLNRSSISKSKFLV